jgi:oligoribonuclease (3'-5' exoribonuclease)
MGAQMLSINSTNQYLLIDYLMMTELTKEFCINILNELDNAVKYNDQKNINDIVNGINYRLKYYKINLQVTHNELVSKL